MNTENTNLSVKENRNYKDTLFRMIFKEPREYELLFSDETLYSTKLRKIPAPNFIVFYNGSEAQPEYLELKLSDAYEIPVQNPSLELKVIQLNINAGYNKELMSKCKTLQEYSVYVEKVRKYAKRKPLKDAVEQAVTECIKDGILSQFLTQYKAEAISMSIFEYDEEKEMALIRRDERSIGMEKGMEKGMVKGIQAFLSLCEELNFSNETKLSKLMEKFQLSETEALSYMQTKKPQ